MENVENMEQIVETAVNTVETTGTNKLFVAGAVAGGIAIAGAIVYGVKKLVDWKKSNKGHVCVNESNPVEAVVEDTEE